MARPYSLVTLICFLSGFGWLSGADAGNEFDGVYRGTLNTIATYPGLGCDFHDGPASLRITDNHVRMKWGLKWPMLLEADVGPDGSFSSNQFFLVGGEGQKGYVIKMKGRIVGGKLEFDAGFEYCSVHYILNKLSLAGPFDGAYRGMLTPNAGNDADCPVRAPLSVQWWIVDNHFHLGLRGNTTNPQMQCHADLAPDGSFKCIVSFLVDDVMLVNTIRGWFEGQTLRATFENVHCKYDYRLPKE
jgi:hypothetical protein